MAGVAVKNVYRIRADGDYFGASYKDTSQGSAVMASDRQNRPVPEGTLIDGWYFPDDGKREPVFTDIGELGYQTTLLL